MDILEKIDNKLSKTEVNESSGEFDSLELYLRQNKDFRDFINQLMSMYKVFTGGVLANQLRKLDKAKKTRFEKEFNTLGNQAESLAISLDMFVSNIHDYMNENI